MNKGYYLAVLAGAVMTGINPSISEDLQNDQPGIRSWSITPKVLGLVVAPRDSPDCGIRPVIPMSLQSLPTDSDFKYYSLVRPSAQNTVAIIKVNAGGSIELNPNGFEYGLIPALNRLTQAQADALWCDSFPKTPLEKTKRSYVLKSLNDKSHMNFVLNVVFKNDHIEKYRIRRIGLDSKWHQV